MVISGLFFLSQQQPTYYGAQSMNDTMSILQEGAKRNEQLAQSGSTAPGDVQSAYYQGCLSIIRRLMQRNKSRDLMFLLTMWIAKFFHESCQGNSI